MSSLEQQISLKERLVEFVEARDLPSLVAGAGQKTEKGGPAISVDGDPVIQLLDILETSSTKGIEASSVERRMAEVRGFLSFEIVVVAVMSPTPSPPSYTLYSSM